MLKLKQNLPYENSMYSSECVFIYTHKRLTHENLGVAGG